MARLAPVPPGSSGPRPAIRNGVPAARRVLLVARRVSLSAHTGPLQATGGDPPCSFHRRSFRLALGSISDCPHPAAHPTFLGLVVAEPQFIGMLRRCDSSVFPHHGHALRCTSPPVVLDLQTVQQIPVSTSVQQLYGEFRIIGSPIRRITVVADVSRVQQTQRSSEEIGARFSTAIFGQRWPPSLLARLRRQPLLERLKRLGVGLVREGVGSIGGA